MVAGVFPMEKEDGIQSNTNLVYDYQSIINLNNANLD